MWGKAKDVISIIHLQALYMILTTGSEESSNPPFPSAIPSPDAGFVNISWKTFPNIQICFTLPQKDIHVILKQDMEDCTSL